MRLTAIQAISQTPPPLMYVSESGSIFFKRISQYLSPKDVKKVRRAFNLAKQAHGDDLRKSGEPFFTHPLTVSDYLAEYYLDAPTLIAALLHDVAEDTIIGLDQIEHDFGEEVRNLVDGVTKLKSDKNKQLSQQEIGEGTLHKLFTAMTGDVRVVLIKIFDRLHNMRTMQAMPIHKQKQKARETIHIYARLADRLGMWHIKNELESRSLEILDPRAYTLISRALHKQSQIHAKQFPKIKEELINNLKKDNIHVQEILIHPRNVYSVYRELQDQEKGFDDIDHSIRITILVEDEMCCYKALGNIHRLWSPVAHSFDDYIAVPRDNLYQSLHTTVIHEVYQRLKLRIRTPIMNEASEYGVLAKWHYNVASSYGVRIDRQINTFLQDIRELIELELKNIAETVQGVQDNYLREQILVYTRDAEPRHLPTGATPLDFAYMIHSQVGHRCQKAFVDGKLFPLRKSLSDGDQVRIELKEKSDPQRIWLDEHLGYLTTSRAKERVRRWLRQQEPEVIVKQGRDLLENELAMLGLVEFEHDAVAKRLGYQSAVQLYTLLGNTEVTSTQIAVRLLEYMWTSWLPKPVGNSVTTKEGETYCILSAENHQLQLCQVCEPVPGDRIMGFLRTNGGVTVHRLSCHMLNMHPMENNRLRLDWGDLEQTETRIISICVDIHDRVGIVHEITDLFRKEKMNINYIEMPRDTQSKHLEFGLEVSEPYQLIQLLHRIGALDNVFGVRCLVREMPAFLQDPNPHDQNKSEIYFPPE